MTIDQVRKLPPALTPWEVALVEMPQSGARMMIVVERKSGHPRWAKIVAETEWWAGIEAACQGHSSTTPQRPTFVVCKDPKVADRLRDLLEPLRVAVSVGPTPAADAGAALLHEPPGDTLLEYARAVLGDDFDVDRPIDDVLADVDFAAAAWNAGVDKNFRALVDQPPERVRDAMLVKLRDYGDDGRIFEDVTIRRTIDGRLHVSATARTRP